jgi:predicted NBD/HSP70 family sugar kinase
VNVEAVELYEGAARVLDSVRLHGCNSRVQIMQETGLSRMVTAQRVQQLLDVGLLQEEGLGPSSGGRRPRKLAFRPTGHLLVADVGWTSIDVAVADLTGRLLAHIEEEADVTDGPQATLERLERLFEQVAADLPDPSRLWGVGVGIPAPVEFSTGRAVSPAGMPEWDNYPLREQLHERYDVPVFVDNDVNIMLLGECRGGAAAGHRNAAFVKLGTGIGIGLISEGHLHRGAQGCAGRIGNLINLAAGSDDFGFPPHGESPSSWTTAMVARQAGELAAAGSSPWLAARIAAGETVTAKLAAEAAAHGDTPCFELLRRAGALLGTMLAAVVSLYNPSVLIVGGGMSQAGDFFLAAIRQSIHGQAVPLATRDLRIVTARLGSTAGVSGAATMVLDQLFSDRNLAATAATWLESRRTGQHA